MIRLFCLVYACLIVTSLWAQRPKEILYVGTFFGTGSEGIYVLEFDRVKGRFTQIQVVPTLESPTFLDIHPSGKFLYSVNRGPVEQMENSGSVSAFAIDGATGKLTLLNERPSYGNGPCHISVGKTGQWAFISNYHEGNFVIMPIFDDGLLGSSAGSRRHLGSSVNPGRQEKPHVHSAVVAPDNNFVLVSDLGTDKIHSYRFNSADGTIADANVPFITVKPGSGPRHLAFHPNGSVVYSAEELTSTVAVLDYDKATGTLTMRADSILSLPADFHGENTAADIHVHPNGRFLYMSNRGHNALAIYKIDKAGMITLIGHQDTRGKTPRNFLIDGKGEFLWVAHQDSNNIVTFRVNPNTGKLTFVSDTPGIPSPVCLKMLALK
ncbi:MAG TPA: lactonase family protein [Cyclobacteriaceae bacterium]|nr:lactonase family protein [Cyclobacteriaceae bacterium]